jgi:hypothetical protein
MLAQVEKMVLNTATKAKACRIVARGIFSRAVAYAELHPTTFLLVVVLWQLPHFPSKVMVPQQLSR